ncbi:MAG TPA: adenylate/guanylate cyclase domain-containing protein [Candidatus Cybelea sp.]|jgi:predicted ATPase/class 3 adenylate cyclase
MSAPESRPSGTVTFLFSDIEGSTLRWQRDPQAMADALARHNELFRAAIESNGGYVFKTVGDAFYAAFAGAPEAVAAALAAQRALNAEDFSAVEGVRVRIALHAGYAREQDGDYFGTTLNRVARLVSIGHGGQTLLSGTAAELVRDALPPDGELRDLGAHRLKDLARPERVFQLVVPDLLDAFPSLRSLDYLPNNLPQQLTSFIGRAGIVEEVKAMLHEHRLATLVGAGGAGKTRCAIQTGAELLNRYPDGVWLVELAPISDPALVTTTIARVLGVRETRDAELLTTLLGDLEQRRLLFVLDNCEHLVDETRRVASAIIGGCAGVGILATSREQLGISGERVLRMPSLQEADAVELFADRARAADDRFALTAENEPFVAEICRRLDGIPLAVELAAARVKLLSPKALTEKLSERFRVLTGGSKDAVPRHHTLRATIDWSFDLLDEPSRALFRTLSVFVGGWTLDAATAVCAQDGDEWGVLDLLSSLVDKSLVAVETKGEERRYDMLVSIREYASERLAEAGEAQAAAAKHARFYAALAKSLAPLAGELEDVQWQRSLAPELDNLRAAIDWTIVSQRDPQLGMEMLSELEWPELIATPHEALRWFEAALRLEDRVPSDLILARLLRHCVILEWLTGQPAAHREQLALAAVAVARRAGDPDEVARVLGYLGATYAHEARFDDAERVFAQAYAAPAQLSRAAANAVLRMWAAGSLARGDVDAARKRFSEVARCERPGSEAHASALLNLGELEYASGDLEAAQAAASQAKAAYTLIGSVYTVLALSNLAAYAMEAGNLDDARGYLREALQLQPRSGRGWLASVIEAHALLAALSGDFESAALLGGFSDSLYRARGEVRQQTEHRGYERLLKTLAEACSKEEIASAMESGARIGEKEALARASAIYERHGR